MIKATLSAAARLTAVQDESPVFRKLAAISPIHDEDRVALSRALSEKITSFAARAELLSEGDEARFAPVVLEGWAARYRSLPDGRRQLTGFLLPGDICGPDIFVLPRLDHSIAALSPLRCALLSERSLDLLAESPAIAFALARDRATAAALQREWITGLGLRQADQRIAQMLSELCLRLRLVGHAAGGRFAFPMTQADIAEATGLSKIHVNRVIASLRRGGLARIEGRMAHIPDLAALMRFAQFTASYLRVATARERGQLEAG